MAIMQPIMRLVYTSTWCSMYWINATLVKHPDVFTLIQFCVCARANGCSCLNLSSKTRMLLCLSDGLY